MERGQFRQLGCRHQVVHIRQRNALEYRSQVAATVGSVHEGVKQVAFGVLVVPVMLIRAMRPSLSQLTVSYLMQVAHSCQHGGCQHGEHQQEQHRKAQQAELAKDRETGH
jgi:hypothetical protein